MFGAKITRSLTIAPRIAQSNATFSKRFYSKGNYKNGYFFGSNKSSSFGWKTGIAVGLLASPFVLYSVQQNAAWADEQKEKTTEEISTNEEVVDEKKVPLEKMERKEYKYVIIGGGTTGFAALQELLERDPGAKILLVTDENDVPYSRPPLSKELWRSDDPNIAKNLIFKNFEGKEQSVYYEKIQYYKSQGVDILLGQSVIDVDVFKKAVLLDNKVIVDYDKCLIATGGKPRNLPNLPEDLKDKFSTYRTLDDFKKLDQLSKEKKSIVVIGGGFLGSELSCGLALRGKQTGLEVTQVFPESGLMGLNFPQYLSDYTTNRVKQELGYNIVPERLVKSVSKGDDGKVLLHLDNGSQLEADHVVVAIGIKPNVDLAMTAELEVDSQNGGIVVNSELQARSDLYVAGDVASYYDAYLGRRRVEHYDQAAASGKHAAKNMTGAREPYMHLPFFWSDVSSMGYEAVGNLDAKLRTVGVWEKPENKDDSKNDFKRGIVYYLGKDDRVVGVILWNLFGKVEDARTVIKRGKIIKNEEELKTFISIE